MRTLARLCERHCGRWNRVNRHWQWLWQEAASGFDQLDRGDSVEMDRDAFMNHFRTRRQAA